MNPDNVCIIAFALVLLSIVGGLTYNSKAGNDAIISMVQAGASPIAAKCVVTACNQETINKLIENRK